MLWTVRKNDVSVIRYWKNYFVETHITERSKFGEDMTKTEEGDVSLNYNIMIKDCIYRNVSV